MKTIIKDWFTSRNGADFSLSKMIAFLAGAAMITQFVRMGSVDFTGFGVAIAAIIAALAGKYFVDTPEEKK